jgi:hypothetical protein
VFRTVGEQPSLFESVLPERSCYGSADEEQEGHPPASSQDWQDWQEEWRRDLGLVARAGRLTTPWAPRPVLPRPSDALALRHWYRAVATASWCHSGQTLALVTNAVESDWKQATLPAARRSARTWESVGTAFTDAAMYWLPSDHTAAHADSEPLDSDAALDLRLPYDAVFLAFADPILLPPIDNTPAAASTTSGSAARPPHGPGRTPIPQPDLARGDGEQHHLLVAGSARSGEPEIWLTVLLVADAVLLQVFGYQAWHSRYVGDWVQRQPRNLGRRRGRGRVHRHAVADGARRHRHLRPWSPRDGRLAQGPQGRARATRPAARPLA